MLTLPSLLPNKLTLVGQAVATADMSLTVVLRNGFGQGSMACYLNLVTLVFDNPISTRGDGLGVWLSYSVIDHEPKLPTKAARGRFPVGAIAETGARSERRDGTHCHRAGRFAAHGESSTWLSTGAASASSAQDFAAHSAGPVTNMTIPVTRRRGENRGSCARSQFFRPGM
jgi:hypothetical protein